MNRGAYAPRTVSPNSKRISFSFAFSPSHPIIVVVVVGAALLSFTTLWRGFILWFFVIFLTAAVRCVVWMLHLKKHQKYLECCCCWPPCRRGIVSLLDASISSWTSHRVQTNAISKCRCIVRQRRPQQQQQHQHSCNISYDKTCEATNTRHRNYKQYRERADATDRHSIPNCCCCCSLAIVNIGFRSLQLANECDALESYQIQIAFNKHNGREREIARARDICKRSRRARRALSPYATAHTAVCHIPIELIFSEIF